ncbi:MAG: hypothetical protein ACFFCS_25325 [Candidatus Hodarchaeota archaeon]
MKKIYTFIGAIVAIISLIPIEIFAWWTVTDPDYPVYSGYINGFSRFVTKAGSEVLLGAGFAIPVMCVVIAILLMIVSAIKNKRKIAIFGGILSIAGSVIFMVMLIADTQLHSELDVEGENVVLLFGTAKTSIASSTLTYYLNVGFFLPIGAALLVFLSISGKVKADKIVVKGSEFSEFNLKAVPTAEKETGDGAPPGDEEPVSA